MRSGAEVTGAGMALELRGATLHLGDRVIWEGLDLDVAPGECLAVLGPNGAGKTTLLKVLLGLLPLAAGTVTLDGQPPRRGSAEIGYVAQQRDFDRDLPVRGRDLVQFGVDGHRHGVPWRRARQVDATIAALGAGAYANAPVGQLSGGQQQRLRIAQSLVGEPRLLLCDEPLLSLDPASQQAVVALVDRYHREHGTTVVFVTHEINPVISFVDRILYVAAGRWAAGSTEDVMTTEALSALYGTHVDVVRVHDRILVVGEEGRSGPDIHHLEAYPLAGDHVEGDHMPHSLGDDGH